MRLLIIKLITLYQKTLSPDHGFFRARHSYGFCKFYPTCSEYAKQAVMQKGVILGIGLSISRVVKCNPWSKGGVDTIPNV